VDEALQRLEPQFRKRYSHTGRPSIAPERLLRARRLQVLYGVRSERQRMAERGCPRAWRWVVGLSLKEEVWDASVFPKNRARFLEGELAQRWLRAVVRLLHQWQLIDEEHFRVDATLIRAHASERSYQPQSHPPAPGGGSGRGGEWLQRDTHESPTDPEAQL